MASNLGRIRTTDGRVINAILNKGRWHVSFAPYGQKPLHQLVCRAFKGPPPPGKPWSLHRNGIATDNHPSNLYWGTPRDNAADSIRHGTKFAPRGERTPHAKLTEVQAREIKRRRASGERGCDLAREFKISQQTVCCIKMGRQWGWLK
jgi:hypothetical protein